MAETVAFTTCLHCGKPHVAVKINRSAKAYATCDHCGIKWQHTWQRTSDAHVQALTGATSTTQPAAAAPKPAAPAAPATPKPAPAAPKVPAPPPKPPAAAAPAPRASTLLG